MRTLASLALLGLVVSGGYAGYRVLESRIAVDVYRARVAALSDDYEQLRLRYDEAVRKTAVTELVVRDGRVSVSIRSAAGELETIETGLRADAELYVDYAVVDGRLWIRRVFDAETPPREGVVIDPRLAQVDWDGAGAAHGKAVYRSLAEGRWVVTVTGDGSLGLAPAPEASDLAAAPPVRSYAPIDAELDSALARIRPAEVLAALGRRLEARFID